MLLVLKPSAIRAHTSAQSPSSTTTTAQPSQAENPLSKSSITALPTSIIVAETHPLEENPTSTEATLLTSQPIAEG